MTLNSTSEYVSIFKDGKLKSGIYEIQNIESETYLDIQVSKRELCCRPAANIGKGRGRWEIKSLGDGYSVKFVEPGRPKQYCIAMQGPKDTPITVSVYPVAWRVEVVNDDKHRGFEYVRIHWGTTNWVWHLNGGSKGDGGEVVTWVEDSRPRQIWKLIPVEVEGGFTPSRSSSKTPGSGSPPSYHGDATGESSAHNQHRVRAR